MCATLASAVEGHHVTVLAARQGTETFAADEAVLLDGMALARSPSRWICCNGSNESVNFGSLGGSADHHEGDDGVVSITTRCI